MGQYVVLPADDAVSLIFRVVLTYDDLCDPSAPDLGPGAVGNDDFEAIALRPGRALLVQVFDTERA
jgi:hypothetical protein